MKLCKFVQADSVPMVGEVLDETQIAPLLNVSLTQLLDATDVAALAKSSERGEIVPISDVGLLPPIDEQEVWAAGGDV